MVLVDTSIWINHFRKSDRHLRELLMDGAVACHRFVVCELACGNFSNRQEILSLLQALPLAPEVEFSEYLYFIEQNQLFGKGIGFVDIHMLASAQLSRIPLWTADNRLKAASAGLNLHYQTRALPL